MTQSHCAPLLEKMKYLSAEEQAVMLKCPHLSKKVGELFLRLQVYWMHLWTSASEN